MELLEITNIKSFLKVMSYPRSKARRDKKAKQKAQRQKGKYSFFVAFELNKRKALKSIRAKATKEYLRKKGD